MDFHLEFSGRTPLFQTPNTTRSENQANDSWVNKKSLKNARGCFSDWRQELTQLFSQSVHLLRARHCARHWEYSTRHKSIADVEFTLKTTQPSGSVLDWTW
jgi:hypothetical protein